MFLFCYHSDLTDTKFVGCELREVEGLDVWSALLYDTLILDIPGTTLIDFRYEFLQNGEVY